MSVEEPAYAVHSAQIVGDSFARQYYAILQQSPGVVHRFYQDVSKLGRAGVGGAMHSTSTMDAINEKIQSYGRLKADVKFVDAQESYNGGVIVVVAGFMLNEDGSRRGFSQTFFLAPQDKGYYVLNDIFRYVEDIYHHEEQDGVLAPNTLINQNEEQNGVVAPTTPSPDTSPVQENHLSDNSNDSNGGLSNLHQNGEVPAEEVGNLEEQDEQAKEPEPVAEVVDPDESWEVVESNVKVEETPKRSYASIVMKEAPPILSSPNLPKSVPKRQEEQVPVAPPLLSKGVPPSSNAEMADDGSMQEPEGGGYSIYLRNLPAYIPAYVVEEALQRFGPIKSGGVQIVNSKGFCYGFVEFEDAAGAQNAIEASPMNLDGREVDIEEKRSSTSRGNYRSRHPAGRGGGGFRGEESRGRGRFWGGRGYGRRDSSRNDFGGRGGGRGDHKRSEGHQRSDQTGNGSERGNRGGGSGRGNLRAPRVSAQA